MLINLKINYECWVFATEPEPGTMKRPCLGTVISVQNDTCNAEVTIKQQIILIKQAFPIVPTDKRHEKLGCTPFYSKHLHRICRSFVTVSSRPIYTTEKQATKRTPLECSLSGRWMCLPAEDCLGAAGCVASTMMMYAHLPWLLASGLTAETVGTNGGREGKGGTVWQSCRGGGGGSAGRRLEGQCWGGGEEGAKEPESCIHY